MLKRLHRFHHWITCLAIALIFSVGCTAGTDGGMDYVRVKMPSAAYVAPNGTLLLSVYVERAQRSSRSGWHWVVVEGEVAGPMLTLTAEANSPESEFRLPKHLLVLHGDQKNVKLIPPMLAAGLKQPTLPEGYSNLQQRIVEPVEGIGFFRLQPNGQINPEAQVIQYIPTGFENQTVMSKLSESIGTIIILPFAVVGSCVLWCFANYMHLTGPEWH